MIHIDVIFSYFRAGHDDIERRTDQVAALLKILVSYFGSFTLLHNRRELPERGEISFILSKFGANEGDFYIEDAYFIQLIFR